MAKVKVYTAQEILNLKSGEFFPLDVDKCYFTFGGTDPKTPGFSAIKVKDIVLPLALKGVIGKAVLGGVPVEKKPRVKKEKETVGKAKK